MNLEVTKVFDDFIQGITQGKTVHIFEGGARSSKTYSIMQMLILICFARTGKMEDDLTALSTFYHKPPFKITIARAKLTWTKATVLKDFNSIIEQYEIPITPEFNQNRAEQVYFINGSEISFIGLDEPFKLHGRSQDFIWINEAMETDWNDVKQLLIRTNLLKIFDYNPSALDHWVYDKVGTRKDAIIYHSTLLDNDFLPEGVRDEILRLEPTEENIKQGTADRVAWEIYGLGKRAAIKGRIFENWNIINTFPECKWIVYGMDFGYANDPTALIRVGFSEGSLILDELIYETGLTNQDISDILKRFELNREDEIFADAAEPKSIEEIYRNGLNIKPAPKGQDSIVNGISTIKQYPIKITEQSLNIIREFKNYKWLEDKNGSLINKPIDNFNHAIDAVRYAVAGKLNEKITQSIIHTVERKNRY
jgi:phage terminase large subunit